MGAEIEHPLRSELRAVAELAADYLESLPRRSAGATAKFEELRDRLSGPLPEAGTAAGTVLRELVNGADAGLVSSVGPRYFGFVVGGTTPAGVLADWLTSAWDQNAQCYATSPAAAVVESVVGSWLVELLGLPAGSSVGFVTGCQMANFTALACARSVVLRRAGWDLETSGAFGAPEVSVLMSDCAHATVRSALGMLGFGDRQIVTLPSDGEGRLELGELARELERLSGAPMILSLQAGNVNTGAFEPIDRIADLVEEQNAWIHVDGAFGLWAFVSPSLRVQLRGHERADSWATDAHKWLNVPYDSGLVFFRNAAEHRELKSARCAYTGDEREGLRDGSSWVPENSRRARGFVLYAALRELGRTGVQETIERCCRLARRFATDVERTGGEVLNDVVLNQVVVRWAPPAGVDATVFHQAIAARVQSDGRCWLGTTVWKGRPAIRCSVCNGSTRREDIDIAVRAVEDAVRQARNAAR